MVVFKVAEIGDICFVVSEHRLFSDVFKSHKSQRCQTINSVSTASHAGPNKVAPGEEGH